MFEFVVDGCRGVSQPVVRFSLGVHTVSISPSTLSKGSSRMPRAVQRKPTARFSVARKVWGPSFREQLPSCWCRFWCRLVLWIGALTCVVVRGKILTEGAWILTFSLCCIFMRGAALHSGWLKRPHAWIYSPTESLTEA